MSHFECSRTYINMTTALLYMSMESQIKGDMRAGTGVTIRCFGLMHENKLYTLQDKVTSTYVDPPLSPLVGSVLHNEDPCDIYRISIIHE